ncbi:hypothetical protein DFQ27_008947 [Actinomortierella ambigua]|uniref:Lysozyme n=1 Tax=Actinomortierella ambigua TaxID=1343610 RepID=A0A9P6TYA3_9FUNG|nr:hypothetical protein DFQ27_008947 [Actinomortierella ambigua]
MKFTFVLATAAAILGVTSAAACTSVNTAGLNLIKDYEGFVARPRPEAVGLPTVGYGHVCKTPRCEEIPYKYPLTKEQATIILKKDLVPITKCIENSLNVKVKLNKNQWAALTSWTFNVGCVAMKKSPLIRRLNAGENPNTVATQELPKWNKVGDRVLPGLTRRRAAELKLHKTANKSAAHPNCA